MRKIILSFFIILQTTFCSAQQFDPFIGQEGQYHAHMELFFKSKAAELSSRRLLLYRVSAFEHQRVWTVKNLRGRLDEYENLMRSLQRHYQYFRLLTERNRKDKTTRTAKDEMAQQLDACSARVDSVLQRQVFIHLTPAALKAHNLSPYSYLFSQERIEASHKLEPSAEKVSNAIATQMLGRLTDRYDDLIDTIKRGKDKIATLNAYGRHGELFAATLIDITRLKQAIAISHHYQNAPEQYYAHRLELNEDSVKAIFNQVAAAAQVLKEYQQLQQQLIRKKTGRDTVLHSWDIGTLNTYSWQPLRFTEVRELINSTIAPLGRAYNVHFTRLLDPANGLLDIGYMPDRAGGGNSFGTIGTPIGLFMQGFDGGFSNTSTLVHEGGHAIHRQLMSENKVMPSYASGPNFLSEAYAMLNELLLLDELHRRAKNNEEKSYFTRLFVDKLAHEIFTSAEEGVFEQGLYDGVLAGRINGLKDINNLYAGIMKSYDIFFPIEPEREMEWVAKRLVFEDPLYNANYLFAILVTCKLYQLHLQDPDGFASKYTSLLSNGFSEPTAVSVKRYLGFELNYSSLLANAIQLMKEKTAELKQ